MTLYILLAISALLCALVAGIVFCYAVVVMPGLKSLDDKAFIRAFQVTDGVIQNNQPLFMLVWLGSALAVLVTLLLGYAELQGVDLILLLVATLSFLIFVQGVTIVVNLPLNNRLQQVDTESLDDNAIRRARADFEGPWNRANRFRTLVACISSLLLIVLACRL